MNVRSPPPLPQGAADRFSGSVRRGCWLGGRESSSSTKQQTVAKLKAIQKQARRNFPAAEGANGKRARTTIKEVPRSSKRTTVILLSMMTRRKA